MLDGTDLKELYEVMLTEFNWVAAPRAGEGLHWEISWDWFKECLRLADQIPASSDYRIFGIPVNFVPEHTFPHLMENE